MSSYNPKYIKGLAIPMATTRLLAECQEARGRQESLLKAKPEVLNNLKEIAVVKSVESSNRIEGVEIESNRLRPILIEGKKPKTRSEEELLGYRKAMDWISASYKNIEISPISIQKLHKLAQDKVVGDAGIWKTRDNEIIEILDNGERLIRFIPTSAKDTPKAMEQLCLAYKDIGQKGELPTLINLANCIFDFLCIHPFRDGNGRVSRLLTFLLLLQENFLVASYISLERLIEEEKEEYYRVLKESSSGWHNSEHNLLPWWNFFLSILRRSYQLLEEKVEQTSSKSTKSDLVKQTINEQTGNFTLKDISQKCPNVSQQLIKKVFSDLKKEGKLGTHGHGRGASWRKLG